MTHEVLVVGGGIGGLTVAALLAARGVDVCLFERDSRVGGCAQNVEKFGYQFESGAGLYTGWRTNEIYDRIFAELGVAAPEVLALNPSFIVRLPDGFQIAISADEAQFEDNLRSGFPECADEAIEFHRAIANLKKHPHFQSLTDQTRPRAFKKLRSVLTGESNKAKYQEGYLEPHLEALSFRFRRFLDIQLSVLAQTSTANSSYLYAASVLNSAGSMFAIRGGGSALAEALAASIRKSGGKIRMDTTVLRLTPDSLDRARGVDLLNGETVQARKAVISNLTVWDTYGKLLGLSRTSSEVRKQLDPVQGHGAYIIYAGMEEAAGERLPASRILALSDWQENVPYDPVQNQLAFCTTVKSDPRAPEGKRAVTVSMVTDAAEWFTFHQDQSEHEEQDQETLENSWNRLHAALPELGGDIEVIETATPRTFYEQTRRKLGMVGSVSAMSAPSVLEILGPRTMIPNLFRVGDTVFPGGGLAAVSHSALQVADLLTS